MKSLKCLAIAALALHTLLATADVTSPFVCAFAGTDNTTSQDVQVCSTNSSVSASRADQVGDIAKSRAKWGSLGYLHNLRPSDRTFAGAMWSDGYVVTGFSGTGTANFSLSIEGTFSGVTQSGAVLYYSSTPFSSEDVFAMLTAGAGIDLPGATTLIGSIAQAGQDNPNRVLQGSFSFTFGQSFYLLGLFVGGGETADFYNSQNFGITFQAGAAYSAVTGTVYASSVPEPNIPALVLAGLFPVWLTSWRSRQRKTEA